VARKQDAELDRQAKAILEQLNTLTAGPPPAATGKVGDQTPNNVFSPTQLDTVKNQIRLGLDNLEALNVLNTIGEATGTQSSSGPLVGTYYNPMQRIISKTVTTQGQHEWFRPAAGEIWALQAAQVLEDDSSYHNILLKDNDDNTIFIGQETGAAAYNPSPHLRIYGSYDMYFVYEIPTSPGGGNNTLVGSFYRVR
jgi:hypothetical protein